MEPSIVEIEERDTTEENSSASLIHTNTEPTEFLTPEDPEPENSTRTLSSDHSKKFPSPRNRKLSPIPERSESPRVPSHDESKEEPGVTESPTPPNVQSESHPKLGNTISVKDLSLIFDDGTGRAGDDKSQVWLVTNSILFCTLFTIKDWCKVVRFQQTHNQGLRQLLWTVSWDLRA